MTTLATNTFIFLLFYLQNEKNTQRIHPIQIEKILLINLNVYFPTSYKLALRDCSHNSVVKPVVITSTQMSFKFLHFATYS